MTVSPDKPTPLPCLVCKRPLSPVLPNLPPLNGYVQPADANTLTGHGTYGSHVFDPLDGTYVAASVCDDCLSAALADGRAEIVTPEKKRERAAGHESPARPTA